MLDVTLGSLLNESLLRLEALDLLPSEDEDEAGGDEEHDADHISTAEDRSTAIVPEVSGGTLPPRRLAPVHNMTGRGMSYFEDMIETSRLGRIKHQTGRRASRDGSNAVQWEIVEIGGEVDDSHAVAASGNEKKRQKMDVD